MENVQPSYNRFWLLYVDMKFGNDALYLDISQTFLKVLSVDLINIIRNSW